MDDLLALFDNHSDVDDDDVHADNESHQPPLDTAPTPLLRQKQGSTKAKAQAIPESLRTVGNNQQKQQQDSVRSGVVVDDRIGIRMINRKISSTDLMNMISSSPFHTTSQLCAYSLSNLNQLLIEPATILDIATVNGKTNLLTIGIVFTNTGSRIGPSGKASCILSIPLCYLAIVIVRIVEPSHLEKLLH
jgi:hypothetical protein